VDEPSTGGDSPFFTPFFFWFVQEFPKPQPMAIKNHAVNGDHVFLFPVVFFHGLDQQKMVI